MTGSMMVALECWLGCGIYDWKYDGRFGVLVRTLNI